MRCKPFNEPRLREELSDAKQLEYKLKKIKRFEISRLTNDLKLKAFLNVHPCVRAPYIRGLREKCWLQNFDPCPS